jgi:predicted O-methyltransferase YrrM
VFPMDRGPVTVPVTLLEDYTERLRDPGTQIAPNDIKDEMPYLIGTASGYSGVRVLELGVRTGRSTSAFLAAAARVGGHVWSVDIDEPDVPHRWAQSGYWTFRQADDMDITPETEGWPASFHVLFIDTSHQRLHTLAELRKFVPYVAPGGVVLCHDTKLPGREVALALDDFCREYSELARALPAAPGRPATPGPVKWMERGGWCGLGVIERPNG